jgi:ssRNA-specific RNase YbeY (16S rRNA maturation enzyme)
LSQARKFRTTWQMELSRYLVHGLLHLCGYNDQQPQARRRMKTMENRLVRRLANEFPLSSLLVTRRRPPRRRPASKPPSRRE